MKLFDTINQGWDALVWWERFASHKQMGDIVDFWTLYPAWLFAVERYDGIFRDSGERFRDHTWRVARIAAESGGDIHQTIDSFLHDGGDLHVLTPEQVYEQFRHSLRLDAEKLAEHFTALTFDSNGYRSSAEKERAKTEAKLDAISKYPSLALIIGGDRLDNLRDLKYMKPVQYGDSVESGHERQIRKMNSTRRIAEAVRPKYPQLYNYISNELAANRERIMLEQEQMKKPKIYIPAPYAVRIR